ncbi:MAG TPA: PEGA domain-containing protein [Polyangiaceae bacterium]|nr:PEGA domain-containing protein [Polyangiaceae bacterium]
MTNTEGRKAVELDKLASWDEDEPTLQHPITEADIRELLVYSFDSDKQTLVGLGPVERARRSRVTAEIPDSQRMPQSEAPGPFVADDDEVPPSFRKPMVAWWAVVGPAVVAGLAVLALRGAAPDDADAGKLTKAAAPPPVAPAALPAISHEEEPAPPVAAAEVEQLPLAASEQPSAPPVDVDAQLAKPSAIVPPALPVKLAEVPPPSVVVLSKDAPAANLGTVNVTSNPPANVVLDGRPIGMAPRLVQVPAGVHKLVFIHPLYGRQSKTVNVTSGETANASANF